MITDLAMTENLDVYTEVGEGGRDLVLACNHEVVSNLVYIRLNTEIDWRLFLENEIDPAILAQQIRFIIASTYGVESVDMSGFNFSTDGRDIDLGEICFVVDCGNSKECVTL